MWQLIVIISIDDFIFIRIKWKFRSPTKITCDLLLLDVCPLGLGIEDIHGNMHTLIRRNTTIPTRTEFYPLFTNAYAYQTTATIRIFEGEHNLTKYNVRSVLTSSVLFSSLFYCRYSWANLVFMG